MACGHDVWTQLCHGLSDDAFWHTQDHANRGGALLCLLVTHSDGLEFGHFVAALMLLGLGWNFLFLGATRAVGECSGAL